MTQNKSVLQGDNSKIIAKKIGIPTMLFLIFSFCCGGAFGVEDMICSGGPGVAILLLALLPFVWALPQAMTAAELGSAIPYTGGFYKWNQVALGEFWGFSAGIGRVIAQYLEMPGYILLASGYIASLITVDGVVAYCIKAAIIIIFCFINLRGIKEVGWFATVISICVLLAFAAITCIGFANVTNPEPLQPFYNPDEDGAVWAIGSCLAIGMWMYSGFTSVSTLAGDCEDKSVVWKSLLIALPIIAAVYILPTVAGLMSVGDWAAWSDTINYSNVASLAGLGGAFAIIAIVANCSSFNTLVASLSRNVYAISMDNLGPKAFTKLNEKSGMPVIAIVSVGIVSLIGCTFSFDTIITIEVMFLMVDYALIWIALIALRIKHPEIERPFKIPFGTVGCTLFVAPGWIICFAALMLNGADYFLGGMIGIALIPILYIFFKRKYGGLTELYPDIHPRNPKTKLAYGDLGRITKLFGITSILSFMAIPWMPFYEGSWGPEYYLEVYGSANAWDFINNGIVVVAIVYAVLTVITAILAKKYDNKSMKPEGYDY